MKTLFRNNDLAHEEFISISLGRFTEESVWLTTKRKELIEVDKHTVNRMLVNNPTRDVTLRGHTVL